LHLDNVQFKDGQTLEDGLLYFCLRKLERVSLRNARHGSHQAYRPPRLPESALISFVRHAPVLRWLRSSLSPNNKASLIKERPGVRLAS
jgi:hypothetical protein